MTLDLGPIKERCAALKVTHECADQNYGCERCEREARQSAGDIPALVAEVEALRAALGAEREACDEWRALFGKVRGSSPMKFVKYHEDKDHYVAALLCERHDARRAPKIGGGE